MPAGIDPGELSQALTELQSSDPEARRAGLQGLQRAVNSAVPEEPEGKYASDAEEQTAWFEARRPLFEQPEVSSVVLASLEDPDPRVRSHAAIVLGGMRLQEVDDALMRHMREDPSHHVRAMCAAFLPCGSPLPEALFGAYVEATRNASGKVVHVACKALGLSGDARAVQPIRRVLDHPDWFARIRACAALIELGAADEHVVAVLEALASEPLAESCGRADAVAAAAADAIGAQDAPVETLHGLIDAARRQAEHR